jgi:hypothetical protein
MLMPLFTVTIIFEDRTFAIEQVDADTAEGALTAACKQPKLSQSTTRRHSLECLSITQVLFKSRSAGGVWNWFQAPHDCHATSDVFGGIIVQTDPDPPTRD